MTNITASEADYWLDKGWRDDRSESITLGKVMLMCARGSRASASLHPELAKILDDNMREKQTVALKKVRAEQRKSLANHKSMRVD
jgi:hypothetical protein